MYSRTPSVNTLNDTTALPPPVAANKARATGRLFTLSHTQATSMLLTEWLPTLGLVFGGCCSNAVTLEQVTTAYPKAGSIITLCQFALISLHGLPSHIEWASNGPRFKPRIVPLTAYMLQVGLFYLISLLNNAAFGYKIPMAVHIIFRSGGLMVSMLMGWLISKKRYSRAQVVSVGLVSLGVLLTTLSASNSSSKKDDHLDFDLQTYVIGIGILSLALVLSGFLGLAQERTHARYINTTSGKAKSLSKGKAKGKIVTPPPVWQESMFYLHFLSLPMFFFLRNDLSQQFQSIHSGEHRTLSLPHLGIDFDFPSIYVPLLANTITQVVCVAGVNRLTTRVSALTVTLVLVVRKAVSLVISIVFAKSIGGAPPEVDTLKLWSGAALVMLGTVGYSLGSKPRKKQS